MRLLYVLCTPIGHFCAFVICFPSVLQALTICTPYVQRDDQAICLTLAFTSNENGTGSFMTTVTSTQKRGGISRRDTATSRWLRCHVLTCDVHRPGGPGIELVALCVRVHKHTSDIFCANNLAEQVKFCSDKCYIITNAQKVSNYNFIHCMCTCIHGKLHVFQWFLCIQLTYLSS